MKKAVVVVGTSAGEAKLTKVIDTLWKENVGANCHCISAKRAKKLEKMLEKWHIEMLEESRGKTGKKSMKDSKEKTGKTATKDSKEKAEKKTTKGSKEHTEKKAAKVSNEKGKKQKKKSSKDSADKHLEKALKAAVKNGSFPLKKGTEPWDDLEDLHEFMT